MNKFISVLSIACLFTASAFAQGGLRYTIQVLKFENKAGWSGQWDLGDGWGAMLTDRLQASGKYIVVAEQDMRQGAMDEQDFAASGRTAGGGKAPVTGQMTPAQLIVKGVITAFSDGTGGAGAGASYGGVSLRLKGEKAMINGTLYIVDTTTGQVVDSTPFEAEVKSRGIAVGISKNGISTDFDGFKKSPVGKVMEKACDDIIKFLDTKIDAIAWTGTVIKGGKEKIIINRGTREGVTVGQVLKLGTSEEIRDPDTGELLDKEFKQTGQLVVIEVKERVSYCNLESGKPPEKGQTVYNK